jgi:hypothetical protein
VIGQFNTITVPAASVTAGQTYWIAVLGPTGAFHFRDRAAVGAGSSETNAPGGQTSLPATWTTGASFTDGSLSGFASGTIVVGPPPPPPPPPGLSVLVGNAATEAHLDTNAAGRAEAFKTTAVLSGSVTALRLFVDTGSTGNAIIGLYTNSATGHPGTLLTTGTITAPTAGANNSVVVTGAAVTAGQTYWIAVLGTTGTLRFRDRAAVGAGASETSSLGTLTSLPATWTTGTAFTDGALSAVGMG